MEKGEDRRPAVWLHFRVPADMHDAVKAMAEQERRSISQMALLILEDGLAARRGEDGSEGR